MDVEISYDIYDGGMVKFELENIMTGWQARRKHFNVGGRNLNHNLYNY